MIKKRKGEAVMGEFKILPDNTSRYVGEFEKCASTLGSCAGQVDGIRGSLGNLGSSTQNIREALRKVSEKIVNEQRLSKDMGIKLGEIVRIYDTAEKRVCSYNAGGKS